jgi:hypothetical protein
MDTSYSVPYKQYTDSLPSRPARKERKKHTNKNKTTTNTVCIIIKQVQTPMLLKIRVCVVAMNDPEWDNVLHRDK